MTSDQGHRNDITNGQRVSRHSLPTLCFLFFSHPHFLKTILSQPASGTFGFSQEGNDIVGVMKVIQEAHKDKTTNDPKWESVTLEPIESFSKPISLQIIKGTKGLENIGLIKQPRLAVMELTVEEFTLISKLKC